MNKTFHLKDDFNLTLNETSFVTIFIESESIKINYELLDGDFNLLIYNNTNSEAKILEFGIIKNSNVNITYIDLNSNDFKQNCHIDVYKDSKLNINSIYLGINNKDIKYDLYNNEFNSEILINNNVVCLNNADFKLDIVGNVKKGAKHSKTHQKSNCLTFESPKRAKIIPTLNIDENDVEASHSLSSGTIDDEVLFYMNTRGLNKKDSLSLLLVSYLLPPTEFFNDFNDGLVIKDLLDKKVNNLCLM